MRIEQSRRLPQQHLQWASAAALGRLVIELGLGARYTGVCEHLARQRSSEPQLDHFAHEGAARHSACLHPRDKVPQLPLIGSLGHDGYAPRVAAAGSTNSTLSLRLSRRILTEAGWKQHRLLAASHLLCALRQGRIADARQT